MDPKFESFPDIKKLGTAVLFITQKIHGANAQVFIYRDYKVLETVPLDAKVEDYQSKYPDKELGLEPDYGTSYLVEMFTNLACGSRSQWVSPGKDNFGFAEMVYANKQEFIDKLGLGRHYGEWAGSGINSGEGLKQKTFVLFDHWKFPPERPLPPNTVVVPVLYSGPFDMSKVEECMNDLRANGSKLVAGFMRPEGVVVRIKGERYKVVFQDEEAKWKDADPEYQKNKSREENKAAEKYGHLLQPMRLEKLLSRDEVYLKEYPKSMGKIVTDYFTDLIKEDQVQGTEVEIQGIRRQLGRTMFKFVQEVVEKQQNANS
jgi:hypothetical protein